MNNIPQTDIKASGNQISRTKNHSFAQQLAPHFTNQLDQQLIKEIKHLAAEERTLTTKILHYLLEIERRRIYAEFGYPSLHQFCVKELQYSDGAAHRRISAMRLLSELPQVEESLKTGDLSLSNASMLQTFFKSEQRQKNKSYSRESKLELAKSIEKISRRECERKLAAISPLSMPQERERFIDSTRIQVQFVTDQDLSEKLERIKNLISHAHAHSSYNELFKLMADICLEKLDPVMKRQRRLSKQREALTSNSRAKCISQIQANGTSPEKFEKPAEKKAISDSCSRNKVASNRYISSVLRQEIWFRDRAQCQICGSQKFLQIDHIQPVSLGGKTTIDNLRLLCASCNKQEAIRKLGRKVIYKYLNKQP